MKKFLAYAAVPLSVFGVVYAFKPDLGFATIFSLIALVAVFSYMDRKNYKIKRKRVG